MSKRIVYSTDSGKMCPDCGQPVADCRCKTATAPPPDTDGIVRLQRQVKGRKGKPVVLITGLPLDAAGLKAVAKRLKTKCGVGGSVEGDTIVIQGDKREAIKTELETDGYEVRLAGG